MKAPKWFKMELTLGSLIGGCVTLVVLPWCKWVTISLFTMQADIADIKRAVVPEGASAFPLKHKQEASERMKLLFKLMGG